MTWNKAWHNVICLGKKKFNLDGSDDFSYYWYDLRKEEEIFSTRPQDGGSVMIWVSFGWVGKSLKCFVDGPDEFEWILRSAEKSSSRHWQQYWWIRLDFLTR